MAFVTTNSSRPKSNAEALLTDQASLELSTAQEEALLNAHQRLCDQFELAFAEKAHVLEVLHDYEASLGVAEEYIPLLDGSCGIGTSRDVKCDTQDTSCWSQYGGFKVWNYVPV